jgi:hypothetical protein
MEGLAFDVNQASYVGLLATSSTEGATGGLAGSLLTIRLRGAGGGGAGARGAYASVVNAIEAALTGGYSGRCRGLSPRGGRPAPAP